MNIFFQLYQSAKMSRVLEHVHILQHAVGNSSGGVVIHIVQGNIAGSGVLENGTSRGERATTLTLSEIVEDIRRFAHATVR